MQFWFPELLLSLDNVVLRAVCCLKAGIVADDMLSKVVPINWFKRATEDDICMQSAQAACAV